MMNGMYDHNFSHFKREKTFLERAVPIFMVIFFAFFALAVVFAIGNGCTDQRAQAENQARIWGQSVGMSVVGVSCASRDTDNDGYVSCTVSEKDPTGALQIHSVECAGRFSFNEGCRSPKLRITRAQ